jgi:aerobic-type carbon monoxide dehydrogenase small subunit (CoxS/CutS family)
VSLPVAQEAQIINVTVNGESHTATVEPRLLLADLLREVLGLRGTHLGCEHGVCGACTILIDGEPMRSCLVLAVQADGREVTTVEGLADAGGLHPLQEAFREHHALQCGFCTPGFLLTALYLIDGDPRLDERDEKDLREALSGNLCRCTGYQNIVDAVRDGAARLRNAKEEA